MTQSQPVSLATPRPPAPPEGLAACPCGRSSGPSPQHRPLPYAKCCGRYIDHFDTTPAPDAESLMRSRYTAFVREQAPYLLATWEAAHRPAQVAFDPGVRWLGLQVRAHRRLDGERAEVEFVARQRMPGGRAHRLHELSRFVRQEGRWFYVDGDLR
ncbi:MULTISPECIES: YchJ family metal-binding protein [unclassified Acidovorax]|uniref:YchJ family protein n=1 Tax=unclassified Acidovorax TaxID=2684926 RepID=UPI0023DE4801|nr:MULTISPECIES: YchJ family metal-binding protein [unclassified Acidovorax]GKS92140.1 SEC-C domain-containing protein [Acidovorax sp. SUPP2539]GKS98501.1 SEC-C domain-containing protein [Acidovorax sp. SUPP3434]